MAAPNDIIVCRGLSKQFDAGGVPFVALHDVHMTVPAGQFVAITGASGSGKSTLLNLLGGLDQPSAGSVRVADGELAEMPEPALARLRNRELGFVFQQFQLLPRYDIVRNVELPMIYAGVGHAARASRARALLRRLGLQDHLAKLPTQLSGGQQQRVAIARALANTPRVILADEPTGALDSATGREVIGILSALCRDDGLTVLMVTHDLGLAAHADRVVQFADGRIVSDEPVLHRVEALP